MRVEVWGKRGCDAVSRVKVGGPSRKLSGPLGCVCEGLSSNRARVGGIAGEGRRCQPPLRPPTHPGASGRAACRCERAPGPRAARSGCGRQEAASARAARGRQRAVMSVAAQLAAAGTSCIKAGGPGCDSREPGLGSGRLAAAAEQREGCHIGEPSSRRDPRAVPSVAPAPGGVTSAERRLGCARARGSGRMAVLKLCDQVGARGAEKGARRAQRARRCLRAGQERARPAVGLGSRAVSALGRRKCAFAAGQGRRAAGVAAVMRLGRGAGCGPLPH